MEKTILIPSVAANAEILDSALLAQLETYFGEGGVGVDYPTEVKLIFFPDFGNGTITYKVKNGTTYVNNAVMGVAHEFAHRSGITSIKLSAPTTNLTLIVSD